MPTALTPADFVARFNAVVAGPIAGGSPAIVSSTVPLDAGTTTMPVIAGTWTRHFYDVGPGAEPVFVAGMIPAFNGEGAIIAAFHILHRFAMQLTRIRITRHFYVYTTTTFTVNEAASRRMALRAGLELYFPPPPVPIAGSNITMLELNNFVAALFNDVNTRRNNAAFAHVTLSSCHSSCHASCHGSRGRR
jgi:hypothetical protein